LPLSKKKITLNWLVEARGSYKDLEWMLKTSQGGEGGQPKEIHESVNTNFSSLSLMIAIYFAKP
jgi:hypothetical protein